VTVVVVDIVDEIVSFEELGWTQIKTIRLFATTVALYRDSIADPIRENQAEGQPGDLNGTRDEISRKRNSALSTMSQGSSVGANDRKALHNFKLKF
jgi:hypothetical protein